jgi:hypothetical protein
MLAITNNDQTKQVLELRLKGFTLKECADQVGIGVQKVSKLIRRYMADHPALAAEEFREIELEKYDRIESVLFKKVARQYVKVNAGQVVMIPVKDANGQIQIQQNPDTGRLEPVMTEMIDESPQNEAIGMLLKLWHRRAMLLGIDAPTRVKVDAPPDAAAGMTQDQIGLAMRQWIKQMNGGSGPAVDAVIVSRPAPVESLTLDPILRDE